MDTEIDSDVWQSANDAIESKDSTVFEQLVDAHPELIHCCDILGSCLHFAATEGSVEIVEALLRRGANANMLIEAPGYPICRACAEGHLAVAKVLLDNGALLDVSAPNRNPLFSAIYRGHVHVVEFLLAKQIDCHVIYLSQSGKLRNALSYAIERNRKDIAQLLIAAGCKVPVEGVDRPSDLAEPATPLSKVNREVVSSRDQLIAYMAERFSPVDPLALQEIVPVHSDVRISVHVIRPTETHPFLTLFTTGMSDRPMTVPAGQEGYQYAELVIHLPSKWPHPQGSPKKDSVQWPVEWLRKVAYYPHLNGTWLGGATTIIASDEPPAPLGPNTKLSCLLLLADYPNLIPITLDDGKIVHLYTVVPIYTEERDYELKHGIVALIERLQMLGIFTVVSLKRPNVVKDVKG